MGVMDSFKDKARDAADQHGDKLGEGVERAGDFVDDKTGGKYSEQIDRGQDMARDRLGVEPEEPPQQGSPSQTQRPDRDQPRGGRR